MTEEQTIELSFFVESAEVIAMIESLSRNPDPGNFVGRFENLTAILQKYQEQPILLNAALSDMLSPLTASLLETAESIRESEGAVDFFHFHAVCKIIQLICRVRGFKHIVKFFSHQVSHMELCIYLLMQQERSDFGNWESRYVLLLWLSTLSLIPFDICSLDSSLSLNTRTDGSITGGLAVEVLEGSSVKKSKLVTDIVEVCRSYLAEAGPTRDAAAYCLSALLTRPDLEAGPTNVLGDYTAWAVGVLEASRVAEGRGEVGGGYFRLLGVLYSLAQVFKRGDRTVLLKLVSLVTPIYLALAEAENPKNVRKLVVKTLQRLGMVMLPPRLAQWRYQRGQRSLLENLAQKNSTRSENTHESAAASTDSGGTNGEQADDDDDDDIEFPTETEEIIGRLLSFLRDPDTVVRWSAAKGIGRITMRLGAALADDVVNGVLETFEDADDDAAWHGGCLCLAELARRGLLLPRRLSELVPLVERAITFDALRGQHSVGSHVRDAACYVCWSFARAYSPTIMRPHVPSLSQAMLVTALYDREINCRRAASAAYQENVGRQGNESFEHGIEIMAIADYFALGSRQAAYVKLGPAVAALQADLCGAFQGHLLRHKLVHWDPEIRALAAEALAALTRVNRAASVRLLRELVPGCTSSSLPTRHGSLLGVARLVEAIHLSPGPDIAAETLEEVIHLVPKLDKARLFRGRGGEALREAACVSIAAISQLSAKIPLKLQVTLVGHLNENLRQPHASVQGAAAAALRRFLFACFGAGGAPSDRLQALCVEKYLQGLKTEENVAATRGYALALGAVPPRLLVLPAGRLDAILQVLSVQSHHSCRIAGEPDPDTRKHCIEAMTEIIEKLANFPAALTVEQVARVLTVLLVACEDYSVDARGDVGSWIRATAIKSIERVLYVCFRMLDVNNISSISSGGGGGGGSGGQSVQSLQLPMPHETVGVKKGANEEGGISSFRRLSTADPALGVGSILSTGDAFTCLTAYGPCIGVLKSDTLDGHTGLVVEASFPAWTCFHHLPEEAGALSAKPPGQLACLFRVESLVAVQSALQIEQLGQFYSTRDYAIAGATARMQQMQQMLVGQAALSLGGELRRVDGAGTEGGDNASRLVENRGNDGIDAVGSTGLGSATTAAAISAPPVAPAAAPAAAASGWKVAQLSDTVRQCICTLLKQLGEKLDSVRECAGSALFRLLSSHTPVIPCIPDKATLLKSAKVVTDWAQPTQTFSFLVQLLSSCSGDFYFEAIVAGVAISVGCLTESTSQAACSLLLQHCLQLKKLRDVRALLRLGWTLVGLVRARAQEPDKDRVVMPVLKTFHMLLRSGVFELDAELEDFCGTVLQLVKDELAATSDVKKIRLLADVLVLLVASADSTRVSALKALVVMLGHKYPKVRSYAAELLYLQFLSDPGCVGPPVEDVLSAGVPSSGAVPSGSLCTVDEKTEEQASSSSNSSSSSTSVSPISSFSSEIGSNEIISSSSVRCDQVKGDVIQADMAGKSTSPSAAVGAAAAIAAVGKHRCGFVRNAAALDAASDLLTATAWDGYVAAARAARQRLCDIMELKMQTKAATGAVGDDGDRAAGAVGRMRGGKGPAAARADELDSYEALVREAGY